VFAVPVNERPMRPAGGDGSAAPDPGRGPGPTQAVVTIECRDGATLITITGEIDLANAETAEQQILQGTGGEPTAVTVDLTGLHYIDSAGLWILFRLGTSLTTAQIPGEVIVSTDGPVRRMVETAGVTAAIPVRTA
jgi:anti-sigma B factor antagonist